MNPKDDAGQPPTPGPNTTRETHTYPRLQVPLFGTEYLEYARRQLFTRHPDYLPTLVKLMDIHPGMNAVDVHCGAGFYTRLLASRLQGEGHVMGIDPDPALLTHAQQATIVEGWNEVVAFRLGHATALPLPDGVADLVFANSVLWTLPEAQRIPAVHEMWRVARKNGRALVNEPDGGLVHLYDPNRPELQALEAQVQAAFERGALAMDGHDYQVGRKLPAIFQAAGFERVRLYPRLFVVAGCDLGPDPKQGIADRVIEYQQALAAMTSDTPEARARREHRAARLRAGGLADADLARHEELTITRLRELTDQPQRILTDTSVYLYGGLFCEGYRV
jgi:ubiquinone/menaquinone biosynthesis C-methylase UbiE